MHSVRQCLWLVVVGWLAACTGIAPPTASSDQPGTTPTPAVSVSASTLDQAPIIPKPVSVMPTSGRFTLQEDATIYVDAGAPQVQAVGEYLAAILRPATGYDVPVVPTKASMDDGITLTLGDSDPELGAEGYAVSITETRVVVTAPESAGLFWGSQTLRQLFPPTIEASTVQAGPWTLSTGTIRDFPRYPWRGAMLDVARHFFEVEDVKRYIDLLAYYKLNRLHLHLTDDQGWRVMIDAWPRLAAYGGSTEVGGGEGGYYSQADYAEIVAYAQARHVVVVPEVDMPGHTNAALAAYPELNCDGEAPPLFTGMEVGFSSLCVDKELTYTFVEDVVRELAALTPGPYFHVGGDEANATTDADYVKFVERVQSIVNSFDKRMVGWEEIAQSDLAPTSHAYLDMKYDNDTRLGLTWAGPTSVQAAYDWDPATHLAGVTDDDILGVEAPLWTETVQTLDDLEYLAFPRLAGHAEIAWSPVSVRGWEGYRLRLAAHGPRWENMDVDAYRSPQIPWP